MNHVKTNDSRKFLKANENESRVIEFAQHVKTIFKRNCPGAAVVQYYELMCLNLSQENFCSMNLKVWKLWRIPCIVVTKKRRGYKHAGDYVSYKVFRK